MKTHQLILLLGGLLFPCFCFGQIAENQITLKHATTIRMGGEVSFDRDHSIRLDTFRTLRRSGSLSGIVQEPVLIVKAGELLIDFTIQSEGTGFLDIRIDSIINFDTRTYIPVHREMIYGDFGEKVEVKTERSKKRIRLANNAENINPFQLEGQLVIQFTVQLYDFKAHKGNFFTKIRCNGEGPPKMKVFRLEKGFLSSILATGLSAGVYIWGVVEKDKALDLYNRYRQSDVEILSDYRKANKDNKRANTIKDVGKGLGVATVSWFILQLHMNKTRKKLYNCKCDDLCINQLKGLEFELFDPARSLLSGNGVHLAGGIGLRLYF